LADLNLAAPPPIGVTTPGADGRPDAINRGKHPFAPAAADGLPDDVRTLADEVRAAIARGDLAPDPSGYAIHKHVMGGRGDKARASRVATLVSGWRPHLDAAPPDPARAVAL
jgi:hypothetical protein